MKGNFTQSLSVIITNGVKGNNNRYTLICPPILRQGVFTTACVDNIHHSLRTANESFHGTAISITLHLENSKDGIKRLAIAIDSSNNNFRSLRQLPASYTTVYPFVLKSKDIFAPSLPESNNNAVPLYTHV